MSFAKFDSLFQQVEFGLSLQTFVVRPAEGLDLLELVFSMHSTVETTFAEVEVFALFAVVSLPFDWLFSYALVAEVLCLKALFARLLLP